jgi:molybdate transport system substrate-binding protein
MWKKSLSVFPIILIGFLGVFLSGCDRKNQKIVVYSGQGLVRVMEEIKRNFENKHDLSVEIIYAGSETLLTTITKTRIGDVYIPGSVKFIRKAGDLVLHHQYVSLHVPAIAVRKDNPNNIQSFGDLLKPGVKIAIGNKNMCAIGRVSEEIIKASSKEEELVKNISITGSTVNELLDLVLNKDVDASLVWRDMKLWPEAKDLKMVEISQDINKPKKIHIAVLSTATDKKNATLFVDFVATEGRTLFVKHGFGE